MYRIEVQAQINVQVGEFLKINKSAVQNKLAGETSCKKSSNVQDLIDVHCSVMMKLCEIQLSVVLKELEWFLY